MEAVTDDFVRRRYSGRMAAVTSAAAVWLLAPGAAHALACDPGQPTVTLAKSIPQPKLDNTLTQPQLQSLPANGHHRGRTLGLYRSELVTAFESQLTVGRQGNEACVRLERVELRVSMPSRTIYVLRERRPGTCEHNAVLEHERKHQAVDDAVVAEHLPRLQRLMQAAAQRVSAQRVRAGQEKAAQQRLDSELKAALNQGAKALEQDRAARQQAVDTPQEYARVAALCDPLRNRG
jgi:hypothetical protein